MGTRLIIDPDGGSDSVAMYDSVTGWAFGPVFATSEDAEAFIEWLPLDARTYSDQELAELHKRWNDERKEG